VLTLDDNAQIANSKDTYFAFKKGTASFKNKARILEDRTMTGIRIEYRLHKLK